MMNTWNRACFPLADKECQELGEHFPEGYEIFYSHGSDRP